MEPNRDAFTGRLFSAAPIYHETWIGAEIRGYFSLPGREVRTRLPQSRVGVYAWAQVREKVFLLFWSSWGFSRGVLRLWWPSIGRERTNKGLGEVIIVTGR